MMHDNCLIVIAALQVVVPVSLAALVALRIVMAVGLRDRFGNDGLGEKHSYETKNYCIFKYCLKAV